MKSFLIFIAGGFTAIGLLTVLRHARINRSDHHHLNQSTTFDLRETNDALLIDYREPVFVTDQNGDRFTLRFKETASGAPIRYFWISTTDKSLAGSGQLFSSYYFSPTGGDDFEIVIHKSKLIWSPDTHFNGALYFNSDKVSLSLKQD